MHTPSQPVSRRRSDETIDLRNLSSERRTCGPAPSVSGSCMARAGQAKTDRASLQSNICLSLYATSVRFVALSFFMIFRMWTLTVLSQRLSS